MKNTRFFSDLEAEKQEQINRADGEAKAILAVADAKAKSIEVVASSLKNKVRFFVAMLAPCYRVYIFDARCRKVLMLPRCPWPSNTFLHSINWPRLTIRLSYRIMLAIYRKRLLRFAN